MDSMNFLHSAACQLFAMVQNHPEIRAHTEFSRLIGYLVDQTDPEKRYETVFGADLIYEERVRQKDIEKFSDEHDDRWVKQELLDAAYCYFAFVRAETDQHRQRFQEQLMNIYPQTWAIEWWKPTDSKIRNLVKAGALIAAEIDRLKRMGVE